MSDADLPCQIPTTFGSKGRVQPSGKVERHQPKEIRGLLARAFGFRDHEFLKLRLYALHEAKFIFVG